MRRRTINVPLALALITAFLYGYGVSFQQGYLIYWGLDDSMFPIAFERTLFRGFIGYGYLGSKTTGFLVLTAIALTTISAVATWLVGLLRHRRCVRWFSVVLRRRLRRPLPKPTDQEDAGSVARVGWLTRLNLWVSWIVAFQSLVVMSFLLAALLMLLASIAGRWVAKDQDHDFQVSERQVTVHLAGGDQFEAFPITCSATHCAYLVGERVKLYPLSSVRLVESVPQRDR